MFGCICAGNGRLLCFTEQKSIELCSRDIRSLALTENSQISIQSENFASFIQQKKSRFAIYCTAAYQKANIYIKFITQFNKKRLSSNFFVYLIYNIISF